MFVGFGRILPTGCKVFQQRDGRDDVSCPCEECDEGGHIRPKSKCCFPFPGPSGRGPCRSASVCECVHYVLLLSPGRHSVAMFVASLGICSDELLPEPLRSSWPPFEPAGPLRRFALSTWAGAGAWCSFQPMPQNPELIVARPRTTLSAVGPSLQPLHALPRPTPGFLSHGCGMPPICMVFNFVRPPRAGRPTHAGFVVFCFGWLAR